MSRYFPAKEVMTGVWVGSKGDALSNTFFRQHNIRYVVNCSKGIPFNPDQPQLEGLRIPVDDKETENTSMLDHLEFAVHCVVSAMESSQGKYGCLIHCLAGQQRSPTIAAAVLMKQYGKTPEQAIAYIQKIKPEAFQPKPTFLQAMQAYHQALTTSL